MSTGIRRKGFPDCCWPRRHSSTVIIDRLGIKFMPFIAIPLNFLYDSHKPSISIYQNMIKEIITQHTASKPIEMPHKSSVSSP